jgi:hypothetical protein
VMYLVLSIEWDCAALMNAMDEGERSFFGHQKHEVIHEGNDQVVECFRH